MEQPVATSYGDGKFELVTHKSAEFTEHDPLSRLSAGGGVGGGVGVSVGVAVGGVGVGAVWHSFQPCPATLLSDTQVTTAPLETA